MHPEKAPLFAASERIDMLKDETKGIARSTGTEIDIVTFANLAVDAAAEHKAAVIFRGLRDGTDFDYEMQMAGMNGAMAPTIQTVFVAALPGSATSRQTSCARSRSWAATPRRSSRPRCSSA